MDDPYQCHLRIHLVVGKLFHLGLPLLLNDYLWDPLGVKLVNWFASLETLESDSTPYAGPDSRSRRESAKTAPSKISSKCSPASP